MTAPMRSGSWPIQSMALPCPTIRVRHSLGSMMLP